jgi:hypothetical protein
MKSIYLTCLRLCRIALISLTLGVTGVQALPVQQVLSETDSLLQFYDGIRLVTFQEQEKVLIKTLEGKRIRGKIESIGIQGLRIKGQTLAWSDIDRIKKRRPGKIAAGLLFLSTGLLGLLLFLPIGYASFFWGIFLFFYGLTGMVLGILILAFSRKRKWRLNWYPYEIRARDSLDPESNL